MSEYYFGELGKLIPSFDWLMEYPFTGTLPQNGNQGWLHEQEETCQQGDGKLCKRQI